MAVYDDKTQGIIKSGNCFFINTIESCAEAIFKSSYIVGTNLRIEGKIIASFDLIVLGDVEAQDIDIKGSFTCLGNCNVNNTITVQGKMFVKNIQAKNIDVHDELVAQEIDVNTLNADGNIIVGQTLSVEDSAEGSQKIICGETAYGAGTISAYEIITGEELDMDDGIKSVVQPKRIFVAKTKEDIIENLRKKYALKNDYDSYLTELNNEHIVSKETIDRWKKTLDSARETMRQQESTCYDIGLLLSLTELSNSRFFNGWTKVAHWQEIFLDKFNKMINGEQLKIQRSISLNNLYVNQVLVHKTYGIGKIKEINKTNNIIKATVVFDSGRVSAFQMDKALNNFSLPKKDILTAEEILKKLYIKPEGYGDWLAYLNILRIYGNKLEKKLYIISLDLLYSAIGIKSKFIIDRLYEKGWKDNV